VTGAQWAGVGVGAAVLLTGGLVLAASRKEGAPLSSDDESTPVPGGPDALAAQAGVGLDVYCLARAIASEEGGQPRFYQQAVGCACLNFARSEFPRLADPDAIVTLVLGSAGAFGRQGTGGRRVSSARGPAALQLELAAQILTGLVADPTGGATQWDSPAGQRALMAEGDPLTTKTPQQVADARYAAGYQLVVVPGIDPEKLRFWRR
jgi:hypothetical protein